MVRRILRVVCPLAPLVAFGLAASASLVLGCAGHAQTKPKPAPIVKAPDETPEDDGPALGPVTLTLADGAPGAWIGQRGNYVDTLSGIWGMDNLVIAAGGGGTILRSEDGGKVWTRQASPKDAWLRCVWGSGPDDIFVVGGNAIMHSTDGGITWTPQKVPVSGTFFMAVWGSGREDVYVVGGDGNILNTTDSGKTWKQDPSGVVGTFYDVWGSGADDIYIVGQNKDGAPVVLQSKIGGHLWSKLPVDTLDSPLRQIDGASVDYLYGVSAKGTVYESNDRASTWKSIGSFNSEAELLGIRVVAKGDLYVVGREQTLQHTTDGGKSWKDELTWTPGAAALQGIWGKGKTELFVVGEGTLEAGQKGSLIRRK